MKLTFYTSITPLLFIGTWMIGAILGHMQGYEQGMLDERRKWETASQPIAQNDWYKPIDTPAKLKTALEIIHPSGQRYPERWKWLTPSQTIKRGEY